MAYIDMEINTQNLPAPQPLVRALRAMDNLQTGQILQVTTDEPHSVSNLEAMCLQLGHKLMEIVDWNGEYTLLLRKA